MVNQANDYVYPQLKVESPNVRYVQGADGQVELESEYVYENVRVERQENNTIKVS
jgi:hypothetical protein